MARQAAKGNDATFERYFRRACLHLVRNSLRSLPCRPKSVACFEHSTDSVVRGGSGGELTVWGRSVGGGVGGVATWGEGIGGAGEGAGGGDPVSSSRISFLRSV